MVNTFREVRSYLVIRSLNLNESLNENINCHKNEHKSWLLQLNMLLGLKETRTASVLQKGFFDL